MSEMGGGRVGVRTKKKGRQGVWLVPMETADTHNAAIPSCVSRCAMQSISRSARNAEARRRDGALYV
jgi:hypothetical protein